MEKRPLVTLYEPQDLSTTRPYKFISEREFEQEANQICEDLKDISKLSKLQEADWNIRLKALLRV